MELLRELCEATGISGREERIRAIVRRELEPLVDEIHVDRLGNLLALRRGSVGKKLVLNAQRVSAHLEAVRAVVELLKGAMREQDADGTYSQEQFRLGYQP